MIELSIYKNYPAFKNFVECGCLERGLAIDEALEEYSAKTGMELDQQGSNHLASILFANEQARTHWLLRWS